MLTLSTLFPDASAPSFGVSVERSIQALAARPGTRVTVVAPIGVPPWPLSRLPYYRTRACVPLRETWHGLDTHRPRFAVLPGTGGRFHVAALVRGAAGTRSDGGGERVRRDRCVVLLPQWPRRGRARPALRRAGVDKARGADIHHWGSAPATRAQVLAAAGAADRLLAVGEAMKADMAALGVPAARIRVHHTGVDHARFHPRDRAAAKAALGVAGPVILSLRALIPRKGHHVVVEALAALAALPGATLLIAGEGPERAALAALAARLGMGDRVRLLGSVAHDELPTLLAAADVMALASSSEGLANAWVESLACGTPIVVTEAGSARDVVTSAAAGRVVAREPAAFAAVIAELLAHPPDQAAVAAAAARLSWEANGAALRDHLNGLVRRRDGEGPRVPANAAT